jgi:phage N-6-adenine-methyltransferase
MTARGEGGIAFHSLAGIFPLMDGAEFGELAKDIRQHGLREPIILHEGEILDGRNRYRACIDAGVDPVFETYHGADPLAFVVSLNLKRRHLSESQRAWVAAKIANLGVGRPSNSANLPLLEPASAPVTQGRAAEMLNVSERSVRSAREVRDHGAPELQDAVERGTVKVSTAAEVARLPGPEQTEIVARGRDEILQAAKRIRAETLRGTTGTGENEWYTPQQYVEAVRRALGGIDLDPASSEKAQETVGASAFYSIADDGLKQVWQGRVWLNPPYAQPEISHFVSKMVAERRAGRVTAGIMLTHNYTDTGWFHEAASLADAVCFTKGRIRFDAPSGEKAAPTQGQAFFYFGSDVAKFGAVFREFGFVVIPYWGEVNGRPAFL